MGTYKLLNIEKDIIQPRPIPLYQVWLKTFRTAKGLWKIILSSVILGASLPFAVMLYVKWPWARDLVSRIKADIPSSPGLNGPAPDILNVFTYMGTSLTDALFSYMVIIFIQGFTLTFLLRVFSHHLSGQRPLAVKQHLIDASRKFPVAAIISIFTLSIVIMGYAVMPLIAVVGTVLLLWPILYVTKAEGSHLSVRRIISFKYADHLKGGRILSLAQVVLTSFIGISFSTMWFLIIKYFYSVLGGFVLASRAEIPSAYIGLDILATTGWAAIVIWYAFILLVHHHSVTILPRIKTYA